MSLRNYYRFRFRGYQSIDSGVIIGVIWSVYKIIQSILSRFTSEKYWCVLFVRWPTGSRVVSSLVLQLILEIRMNSSRMY